MRIIERLRAIGRYAKHDPDCLTKWNGQGTKCSCGLDELLTEQTRRDMRRIAGGN